MADFDTAAKRFSGFGIDLPWPVALPPPETNGVSAAERQGWLRKYVGILWSATPFPAYGIDDLTTCVAMYLPTLLPGDQTYDYRAYLDAVRGVTGETRDLNTAQWLDLNF